MPSFPSRAMRGLSDVGDVRRAIGTRRVMHDRDDDRARRASALYEELRLMTVDELIARATGLRIDHALVVARAALIGDIIEAEVQPTTEDVGNRTKEMGPSGSS
jgi:hypothetical protein